MCIQKRNSSVELFRIFCVLAILAMHGIGEVLDSASGNDMVAIIFITSICNMSSSCLMILSGYYGVSWHWSKLITLYGLSIFWSIGGLIVNFALGFPFDICGRQELLSHLFPVLSSRNWFVTGYIYILILSDYINLIPEKLDQKKYAKLIVILLIIFSVLPTIFFFDSTNTGGKGFIHLFIMYLLGAYIKRYVDLQSIQKRTLLLSASFIFLFTGILNLGAEKLGVRFWFLRDCSIFIVAEAAIFCVLFLKFKFYNNLINGLSKNVVSIILGESVILQILYLVCGDYFELSSYSKNMRLFWIVLIIRCLIIFSIAAIIEKIRGYIFAKPEQYITNKMNNICKGDK